MKTSARNVISSLAVAFLLWCPTQLSAQSPFADVAQGPRVGERLVVTLGPLVYNHRRVVHVEFLMVDEGWLVGRDGDRYLAIDTASIRSVRRRIGTKPASAPAMALGSAVGFATGFVIGAVLQSTGEAYAGRQTASNRGLSTGVLIGAPIGALVAWAASRSRPIYETVPLGRARPSVAMDPSGRVGVSLSIPTG